MAEVVSVRDEAEAAELAAPMSEAVLRQQPAAVLGLATGSSPLSTYRALADRALDRSRCRAFAVDEYVGLPAGSPQSYRAVLLRDAVAPLGLNPDRLRVPGDDGGALADAGRRYDAAIAEAGGIDL